MATYPNVLAGARITAALLQSMSPGYVEKPTDQTVTSSTANVNDTALFLPVEANAIYVLEGLLLYSCRDDTDVKIGWTGPSGSTLEWIAHAQTVSGTTAISAGVVVDRQNIGFTSFPLGGAGAENSTVMTAKIRGRLDTAGTAGNLQLNWAQRISNATASIMRAGSWLTLRRVV